MVPTGLNTSSHTGNGNCKVIGARKFGAVLGRFMFLTMTLFTFRV